MATPILPNALCQIQWIDDQGNPTPDTNPAIARVRTKARVEQHHGRSIKFEQSDWYCICAEHAKQLGEPGMHIWECEALEPKHLKRWARPQSYIGANWEEYYSAGVGQSRDSDCLEQSNFAVMLAELGGESVTVIVVRESHWAVGWVEWIAIHESDTTAIATADAARERLANYPILDEDDFGEREWDAMCETWEHASLRERIEYCGRAGISIFAARRAELPQDDNGRLHDYLLGH
jgi:hypothetical protein